MEKLNNYLKSFSSLDEQIAFAKSCGTTIYWLHQESSKGSLFFGPIICRKLEEKSFGLVNRKELRPHDWMELWPELAQQDQNKSEEAA